MWPSTIRSFGMPVEGARHDQAHGVQPVSAEKPQVAK
jgi:hypothetical protein